jgi:hypothetical protein
MAVAVEIGELHALVPEPDALRQPVDRSRYVEAARPEVAPIARSIPNLDDIQQAPSEQICQFEIRMGQRTLRHGSRYPRHGLIGPSTRIETGVSEFHRRQFFTNVPVDTLDLDALQQGGAIRRGRTRIILVQINEMVELR